MHTDKAEDLLFVFSLLKKLRVAYKSENKKIVVLIGDVMKLLGLLDSQWKDFENTLGTTAHSWGIYTEIMLILKRYTHAEGAGL